MILTCHTKTKIMTNLEMSITETNKQRSITEKQVLYQKCISCMSPFKAENWPIVPGLLL